MTKADLTNSFIPFIVLGALVTGIAIGRHFYDALIAFIPLTLGMVYLEFVLREYEKKIIDEYIESKMEELSRISVEAASKEQILKYREDELRERERNFIEKARKSVEEAFPKDQLNND